MVTAAGRRGRERIVLRNLVAISPGGVFVSSVIVSVVRSETAIFVSTVDCLYSVSRSVVTVLARSGSTGVTTALPE